MAAPRVPWKLTRDDRRFLRSVRIDAESDERMTGTRIAGDVLAHTLKPGEYGRDSFGHWYGVTPNGLLAGLAKHQIEEHADGTITVSPSILVRAGVNGEWHGYLVRGEWRPC